MPLIRIIRSLSVLVTAAIILAACGDRVERICPPTGVSETGGPATGEVKLSVTPTQLTPTEVGDLWATGPHAHTDVRSEPDFQQSCQDCHAPLIVTGGSTSSTMQDLAAGGQPGVSNGCAVCHPQEPGQESQQVALLDNPETGEYRAVDSGSTLCETCHTGDQPEGHLPIDLQGVHADMSCLDCHDAHTGQASCTGAGCHQPFRAECEPILTHDKPHSTVTCSACHASGEFQIKWDEELQAWHSFFPVEKAGEIQLKGQHAHNLGREVICENCHTPGQLPWMEDG